MDHQSSDHTCQSSQDAQGQNLNTKLLARYRAAREHENEIQDQLKEAKRVVAELEEQVKDNFSESGTQSHKQPDGTLIYLQRNMFPKVKDDDYDRAIEALKKIGQGDLVRYKFDIRNVRSLVKEIMAEGNEIPPEINEAFDFYEDFEIRMRKT